MKQGDLSSPVLLVSVTHVLLALDFNVSLVSSVSVRQCFKLNLKSLSCFFVGNEEDRVKGVVRRN